MVGCGASFLPDEQLYRRLFQPHKNDSDIRVALLVIFKLKHLNYGRLIPIIFSSVKVYLTL